MPRRARIQIPGGTYYLLQASSKHQPLFESELDYRYLESLVASAVQRSRTQALAFCWLPHELHLAVRSSDLPVSRFMQGFTARYARFVHRRTGEIGHLFQQSFRSLLIDPEAWLPELVRYIHHLPVHAGLAASATIYEQSSVGAYLGTRPLAWLSTKAVLRILEGRGMNVSTARVYLRATPSPEESALFASKAFARARILGDNRFIESLPRKHRQVPAPPYTHTAHRGYCAIARRHPYRDLLDLPSPRGGARPIIDHLARHATSHRLPCAGLCTSGQGSLNALQGHHSPSPPARTTVPSRCIESSAAAGLAQVPRCLPRSQYRHSRTTPRRCELMVATADCPYPQ